ncbi:CNP1-like family protein [Chromobacterium alkanivorans]|uniref:CNP1-like family protein n=1 Tax=Chromobacterium alkanivorans TaxID=1071719 RepID=UPI001968327F|nr:CNP1-like family protein [Chromobacterium alkanivorans]MBN3002320.1 CNP1-like family protein [Chromobacterium alkanivorans]
MKTFAAIIVLALCAAQPALADNKIKKNIDFAPEVPWQEGDYQLPPYPAQPDWIAVSTDNLQTNQYFVDAKTLSSGEDGVVRMIVRVKSPAGAENLSFEGLLCNEGSYRAYAFGNSVDKNWIRSNKAVWRKIEHDDKLRRTLRDLACPDKRAPRDAEEALKRLRQG